jgi:hypothetical protein
LLFFIGALEHREAHCEHPREEQELSDNSVPLYWKPQTDVISMAWSDSISGPWQTRVVLPAASPADDQRAWNCHNSNPSPVVLKNGTVLLMYRGA